MDSKHGAIRRVSSMCLDETSTNGCDVHLAEENSFAELDNEQIAELVCEGVLSSHSLEEELKDCHRAVLVRRRVLEMQTKKSLKCMPVEGFDYSIVRGACCEMVIGHIQIPVGVAGPLLLDGEEYYVPMATTEGCLVASTNRGCKAIHLAGGASSVVLRDCMTRAPVVQMPNSKRAAEVKAFVEGEKHFDIIAAEFNQSSRFARLLKVQCLLGGRHAYIRLSCSTGDAMGMNMVSKGVQCVLNYLQKVFEDMEVISISGNLCADKKATAINWIEGRGKSVICDITIPNSVIHKVLKTTVASLVELNTVKNLVGSALAGSIGGFNAHASNVVSAVFLATGQDVAQNVESSQCLTMLEAVNGGKDLYASVTMPCVEVGTIGGGTFLPSQATALDMLGVKGSNIENPGENAQKLARIIGAAVLAGELSLMSALATGQLVKSHMKHNRSSNSLATVCNDR